MTQIGFPNSKELAQKIYGILKKVDKNYTLRPWNRFNCERTMYMIVPSTEYPAYRFGKYIVYEDIAEGCFVIGLYLEKGLEKCLESDTRFLMDSDWTWHQFIKDLCSSEVEQTLLRINEDTKGKFSIEVSVEASKTGFRRSFVLCDECFIDSCTHKKVKLNFIENQDYDKRTME